MTEFTASNGLTVRTHDKKYLGFGIYDSRGHSTLNNSYDHLNDTEMQALREFFQHERDTELGAWRSKSDRTWTAVRRHKVVYFRNDDHERSFQVIVGNESSFARWSPDLQAIAREYFDAHPEPKPWHEAQVGDVWLLKFASFENDPSPWTARHAGQDRVGVEFVYPQNGNWVTVNDPEIVDARRIWPEEAS